MADIRLGGSAVPPFVPPDAPILPLMVTRAAPDNLVGLYLIGYGLAPVMFILKGSTNRFFHDPKLSPDETTALWAETINASGGPGSILTQPIDMSASATTIRGSISMFTGSLTLSPCWSPDSAKVAFLVPPTTFGGNWSVGVMDADGGNYSVIYTVTGVAGMTMQGLSWSPSGTYLAFKELRQSNGPNKVHICKADGTGGSAVYTSASGASFGNSIDAPAWKHSSDVLGFNDTHPVGTTNYRWYTINGDGTGQTTILDDSAQVYESVERMAWLADDSALVGRKVITGPNYELALIDGAGGGATDSGIDTGPIFVTGLNPDPFVPLLSGETERIYYSTQDSLGQRTISSVLTDFSDVRLEWDYNDFASNYQHHGIFNSSFST